MDLGYASIRGRVRHKDEDSILVELDASMSMDSVSERALIALADGMGGGERGEEASRIAILGVRESRNSIMDNDPMDHNAILNSLLDAMHYSNEKLVKYKEEKGYYSMGTTMTIAYYAEGWLHVVNAGDSRAYIFNQGAASQKTTDNSYVMEMVKAGRVREIEASRHPRRNELTVALGFEDNFIPEPYLWRCFRGDSIMLCCDGLWSALDPTFLALGATSRVTCQEAVNSLITCADELDGSDNISAVLLRPSLNVDEEEAIRIPTLSSVTVRNTV